MDQVKSIFFENQILEAIETVTTSIVSKLKFDQTILCTITDDSNKQNGIYEVTDKTSTFTATSNDTSYAKDMVVYVLIPQGKYENQKTIIGKYVDDTATAINHVASTENIIEIKKFSSLDASCEGWEQDSTKWSLLANKKNNQNDKITLSELFNISWDENTNIYTCVGLKAKFKTRLYDYLIKKGSYGLVLTLQGYKANDEGELKIFQDEYIFNNSEMYGDPYNYNDYVEHDIVFDLTDNFKDIKITGVRLDFYEKNDFLDINNELIPYSYLIDGKEVLYPDNLFVKDIDLIFGYTQDDILKEGIQIYTPDDFKYAAREDSKNILLKWFVQNEIGSSQTAYGIIDELEEVPKENGEAIDTFSIYWYRYKIGNQEPDPILGKGYWEIIPGAVYRDKKFVHEMQNKKVWDVKTKTEVFVYKKDEYGNDTTEIEQEEAPELKYNLIEDNSGRYYKTADNKLAIATDDILKDSSIQKYQVEMVLEPVYNFSEDDDLDEPFRYVFGPNELLSEEKIKAVLKCRKYEEVLTPDEKDETIQYVSFKESYDIYESNELLFENKNPAVKKLSEINLIREMRLSCDDGSNGVYMIYNDITNEIGDSTKTNNRLSVYFDNYSTIDIPKDQEDCKITWKIPASNSMIKPVNFRMENGFKDIRKTNTENGEISGFDKDLVSEDTVAYIPNSSGIDTIAEEEKDPHLIEWSKEPIDGYYQCLYYWTSTEDETSDSIFENQSLYMHYGLNPAYVSSAKNNTIICEIEKYGRVYKAEMSMVFGSAGANGTKYTLYINLEKEYGTDSVPTDKKTGLLDNKKPTSNEDVSFLEWKGVNNNPWIKVVAKLYDEHFTDITAEKKFSWSWHTGKVYGLEMYSDGEANNSNECYIRLTYNVDKNDDKTLDDFTLIDYYGILKVATGAEWLGDNTSLVNYLPIPIRGESSGITEYIGAKKLIYDAQGKAPKDDSFQAAHRLEINGSEVEVSTWELKLIKEDSVLLKSYSPTFDYERTYEWTEKTNDETGEIEKELVRIDGEHSNILKPTDLYFAELNEVPMSIIAYDLEDQVIFNQPLLYQQNQYGVSMLNNWDGAQIVDAAGNKILTALVGAGIKNSNNTFSGVFMGEVEAVGSEKKTGLLGFNQGIHTFGFHTDGTAFIGPSGGGRITFDGNEGIIESAEKNTIFNLKEGSIYLSNSATKKSDGTDLNPSVEIILDSNGRNSGPFFQIQDSGTSNNLIKISEDDYYLQSVAGHTKFDLMKGSIHLSNEDYLDPDGKTPAGKIVIDSDGSPAYFQISHYQPPVYEDDGETIKEAAQESELIHIGPRGYYLQSFNYANGSYEDKTMSDGSTLSVYTPGTGMKIDLKSGTIQGYDFTLVAGQKADANDYRLIITSDQNKKPLTIGSNFYVDWDGSLHANNGKFMGVIEANTGNIGGWTIVKNALYKNTSGNTTVPTTGADKDKLTEYKAVSGSAIIAPAADVTISDLTAFKVWEYTSGSSKTETPEGSSESITVTEEGSWSQSNATANNIVFAIGKNFAIDKDGTIYASGAQLDGIVYKDEITKLSSTLINIAQGNLDWEAYYRKTADSNEAAAREKGDSDEAAARTEADNKLDGRIGIVNLNNNGLISQIGEYNGKSIFVDHTIASGRAFVVEGYYGNDTTFYDKTIGYETEIAPLSKYQSYYDIDNKQYYKSYDNNTLTAVDETSADIDKDFVIRGYYYSGKIYQKKVYVKSSSTVAKNSSTIYLDIDTGLAYVYEDSKFRLTTPDDNIVMFMVDNEGLLTAANAVIAGTIYAHDGYIGGWTIQHVGTDGGLTYGNNYDDGSSNSDPWVIGTTGANLTPGNGLYIQNSSLFGSASPTKQCVFNVGQKFAVDKNGVLYADGAVLNGYALNSEFEELENQVSSDITSLTEKLNYWTDKYGIIVKYKEDTSKAYFITNMPTGISSFKKGTFSGNSFKENGSDTFESMNSTTIYYDITYDDFYILKDGSKVQVTNLRTFSVPLQGLLQANNAVISGEIYATQGWFTGGISASEGKIGGWTIEPNYLSQAIDGFTIALGPGDESLRTNSFQIPYAEEYMTFEHTISFTEQYRAYEFLSGYKYYNYYVFSQNRNETEGINSYSYRTNYTSPSYSINLGTMSNCVIDSVELMINGEIVDNSVFDISAWDYSIAYRSGYYYLDIEAICNQYSSHESGGIAPIPSEATLIAKIKKPKAVYSFDLDTTSKYVISYQGSSYDIVTFLSSKLGYSGPALIFLAIALQTQYYAAKSASVFFVGSDSTEKFSIGVNGSLTWRTKDDSSNWSMLCAGDSNNAIWGITHNDTFITGIDNKSNIKIFEYIDDTLGKTLGGFKINGSNHSDEFWNYSLYTNNTLSTGNHYVGFLRAVGPSSKKMSNVFLGIKQYNNGSINFPTPDNWSKNASYSAYIRFDGKAKFKSLAVDGIISAVGGKFILDNSGRLSIKSSIVYGTQTNAGGESSDEEDTPEAASTANNLGRDYAALRVLTGGFGYYCLSSIPAGAWNNSGVKMYWDVGIDGASGNADNFEGRTYRYIINLTSSNEKASDYVPRESFQFIVRRSSTGYISDDKVYFVVKARKGTSTTSGKDYAACAKAYLGTKSYPWYAAYIKNLPAVASMAALDIASETYSNISDKRLKIQQKDEILRKALLLYNNLQPVSYKYKNFSEEEHHHRVHIGFFAQDVEQEIFKAGLTNEDCALVQIQKVVTTTPGCEDGKKYYLNYNELHGLHVLKNQEQDKRILELEQKVQQLENKILELSGKGV